MYIVDISYIVTRTFLLPEELNRGPPPAGRGSGHSHPLSPGNTRPHIQHDRRCRRYASSAHVTDVQGQYEQVCRCDGQDLHHPGPTEGKGGGGGRHGIWNPIRDHIYSTVLPVLVPTLNRGRPRYYGHKSLLLLLLMDLLFPLTKGHL